MPRRVRGLGIGAAIVAGALTAVVLRTNGEATDPRGTRVSLQRVVGGLSAPVAMVPTPDGRLLVAEQPGRIRVISGGRLQSGSYLDITDRVLDGGERGLLGIALHPGFRTNKAYFVAYTDSAGALRISRFTEGSRTETNFMVIAHPDAGNHNGGQILFGADGFLYVGTGDGGSGGDPKGNAQNLASPLGKVLRVDVNRPGPRYRYSIPADNPFRSGPRPEIFFYGLRNPWRFSLDRQYANIAIADVGQNDREEVNYVPRGAKGLNFGWDCREGTLDTTARYGGAYCAGKTFVAPVHEYNRNYGCAVIGGYVYRGTRYSSLLNGVYVHGDYCSGKIWGLAKQSDGRWLNSEMFDYSGNILTFGQDGAGELYLGTASGEIFRIVAAAR